MTPPTQALAGPRAKRPAGDRAHVKRARRVIAPPPFEPPDWPGIVRRRVRDGLSYRALAEEFGLHYGTIVQGLRQRGIRLRPRESARNKKHGERLYTVWKGMRHMVRGTPGLRAPRAWDDFTRFHAWALSSGYRAGMCLTRADLRRPFTPRNCRWMRRGQIFLRSIAEHRNEPGRPIDKARMLQLHRQGLTPPQIARRLRRSHAGVLHALKRLGVYKNHRLPGVDPRERKFLRRTWDRMRRRCTDPRHPDYPRYGGRGARVCRGWTEFEPFVAWALGSGWKPGLCLSRAHPGRAYSPANCLWRTQSEAALHGGPPTRSRRPRWIITAFGETKGAARWCDDRRCTVSLQTIVYRLRHGWEPEEAITAPPASASGRPATVLVRAFGQEKTVSAWLRDPRCKVGRTALRNRLMQGYAPEAAISAPPHALSLEPRPSRPK